MRVFPSITAENLNQILKEQNIATFHVLNIDYVNRTKTGDEYFVFCDDSRQRLVIQYFYCGHFFWVWDETYDEDGIPF